MSPFFAFRISCRRILTTRRMSPEGRKCCTIPKSSFPRLLEKLNDAIMKNTVDNVKSGFRACGIIPFDSEQILPLFPFWRQIRKKLIYALRVILKNSQENVGMVHQLPKLQTQRVYIRSKTKNEQKDACVSWEVCKQSWLTRIGRSYPWLCQKI